MSFIDELVKEYNKNFEEWEAEARCERRASVNWELVHKRCNHHQLLAIQLFVEYHLFEGAASLANMTVPDFMDLLTELGISMA